MTTATTRPEPGAAPGVIVGAAIGYGLAQVQPFVASIRASGCDAPILLLLDRRFPSEDLAVLAALGVTPHLVWNSSWLVVSHHATARLARLALRSPVGRAVLRRTSVARRLQLQSATNRRFHLYALLPGAHPELFDDAPWVFLTDVRDVHVQADPSAAFAAAMAQAPLHLYAEGPPAGTGEPFRLRDGGNTLHWVRGLGGDDVAETLAPATTICSGTVLVAPSLLGELSGRFVALLDRLDVGRSTFGYDQGALNVLHHTGALDDVPHVLHDNADGGLLTLAAVAAQGWWEHEDGVVTVDGRVVEVVHQFDRVPALAAAWLP